MMNRKIFTAALAFVCVTQAFAYDPKTHMKMSEHAAKNSTLSSPETLPKLGLQPLGLDDESQTFASFNPDDATYALSVLFPTKLSISGLIQHGADYEDMRRMIQAFRHFFNPLNGQGLDYSSIVSGNPFPTYPSPDWALEDKGDFGDEEQPFSYAKARGYFYDALTNKVNLMRDQRWGQTFQTLGHVIHHLQDMAQPQHVRNDLHCDSYVCVPIGIYNDSGYEQWTKKNPPADNFFVSYPSVYSATDTTTFTTPRKLWTTTVNSTAGLGIAEYTNRGFVSSNTLFKLAAFPSPIMNPALVEEKPINVVCQEAEDDGRPGCPAAVKNSTSLMRFEGNTVIDSLHVEMTQVNSRARTMSIFDQDLKDKGLGLVYALNRFTFDEAQKLLVPRAVAYSSGLINYFFRGKMEISLPDEGVYGIVDHAVENQKDTSGFRKIKLKLKNTTPSGTGIESMSTSGKLVAVAKFHRNTCYMPDLSGEYTSPGIDWRTCRAKDEEIVVSGELAVPSGIDTEPQPLTFIFEKPIPINATDLYLQVVFRGQLGEEQDAVAVATQDISEPTYFMNFQMDDEYLWGGYLYDGGGLSFHPSTLTWKEWVCDTPNPPIGYGECIYINRKSTYARFAPPWNFDDPGAFSATVEYRDLPMGSYMRIAALGVPNSSVTINGFYAFPNFSGTLYAFPTISNRTFITQQVDPNTSNLIPQPYGNYGVARGIFAGSYNWDYEWLTIGTDPNQPPSPDILSPYNPNPLPFAPLTPLPVKINF